MTQPEKVFVLLEQLVERPEVYLLGMLFVRGPMAAGDVNCTWVICHIWPLLGLLCQKYRTRSGLRSGSCVIRWRALPPSFYPWRVSPSWKHASPLFPFLLSSIPSHLTRARWTLKGSFFLYIMSKTTAVIMKIPHMVTPSHYDSKDRRDKVRIIE